jgi:hypothetical protein
VHVDLTCEGLRGWTNFEELKGGNMMEMATGNALLYTTLSLREVSYERVEGRYRRFADPVASDREGDP